MDFFDKTLFLHSYVTRTITKNTPLEVLYDTILDKLKQLRLENPKLSIYFKDSIAKIIENKYLKLDQSHLNMLYHWYNDLYTERKIATQKWMINNNQIFTSLKWDKYNLLKSLSYDYFPIKVSFSIDQSKNKIKLLAPSLDYGRFIFDFEIENIDSFIEEKEYLLYFFECKRSKDSIHLTLLLDENLNKEGMFDRLLENKQKKITINSKTQHCRVLLHNYAKTISLQNLGYFDSFILMSNALVAKYNHLNIWHLNDKERNLFDIALIYYFFTQIDKFSSLPISITNNELLRNYYNNQFKLDNLKEYFTSLDCAYISKQFSQFLKKYPRLDGNRKFKYIYQFSKFLINSATKKQCQAFYRHLNNEYFNASAEYTSSYNLHSNLQSLIKSVKDVFKPIIDKSEFEGSFPNYHKIKRNLALYLSFSIIKQNESNDREYTIVFSIAANNIKQKTSTVNSIPYDKITALDIQKKKFSSSSYQFRPQKQNLEYIIDITNNPKKTIKNYIPILDKALNLF